MEGALKKSVEIKDEKIQALESRFVSLLELKIEKVFEPGHEKMCLIPYANNKGADQMRSLISAFVVRCQDRMIPPVYISESSRF